MRTINPAGLELIKSFEGFRSTAYLDGGGVPTIGYGHTKGVKLGQAISKEQAEIYLIADLTAAELAVIRAVPKGVSLSDNQFSSLVSFAFNLGEGNLRKLLNKGMRLVPNRILLFDHDNGKKIPGLTRRRTAERALYLQNN